MLPFYMLNVLLYITLVHLCCF